MHAREWGGPDILVSFVERLTAAAAASSGIFLPGYAVSAADVERIIGGLDFVVFPPAARFLQAAVASDAKVLIPGGAQVGKTPLELPFVAIPAREQVLTCAPVGMTEPACNRAWGPVAGARDSSPP